MKELPPYNPDRKCPKCGWHMVRAIYCDGDSPPEVCLSVGDGSRISQDSTDANGNCVLYSLTEHLHRICHMCGFVWVEKTMEHTVKEETMTESFKGAQNG